jgi:hypothetical protein
MEIPILWKIYERIEQMHCKKRLAIFPSPAGMSLTKLSLAGNTLIRTGRVWLVTSWLGTGKSLTFFYSVYCAVVSAEVSLYDRPIKIIAILHQKCIKIGLHGTQNDEWPKMLFLRKRDHEFTWINIKQTLLFYLLFVAAIAAMQTAAWRSAPLPAPWRQGGWRIITWRPCVHRKWRRGDQLHVVYLLLVALPANHIDFTVAREGNFMIRLRANRVTFPIMQKLEIKIFVQCGRITKERAGLFTDQFIFIAFEKIPQLLVCKSNCLEVATKKPTL